MDTLLSRADDLLKSWRGDNFIFGNNVLDRAGELAADLGKNYWLVFGKSVDASGSKAKLESTMRAAGFNKVGESAGAAPNSPDTDVIRVADDLKGADQQLDFVLCFGGGSLIDAAKGSVVLHAMGGECEDYFGVNVVTEKLAEQGREILPIMAIITCSASSAHLTKYSNITNMTTFQKKLIIDQSVVPKKSMFDYALTTTMNHEFTMVGGWDGIGHLTEVYWGAKEDADNFGLIEDIVLTGMELIVANLPTALESPGNLVAREGVGVGTDLGGYAIMVGSTNGPHLNSFSLVDLVDHGMGVALLNPYYGNFFAPAIPGKLKKLTAIYQKYGFIGVDANLNDVSTIGEFYARASQNFARSMGFPTKFEDIAGFTDEHMTRMLTAAKNPQLVSKLKAMPVPMSADDVDPFMGPILDAARTGDFSKIVYK